MRSPVAGSGGPALPVLAAFLVALALVASASRVATAATVRSVVEEGMVAALADDGSLALEALPERGEGLIRLTRRLAARGVAPEQIAAANGGVRRLVTGVRYRVPFDLLRPDLQLAVVRALFTADRGTAEGWEHEVLGRGGPGRTQLWRVAEWFTGGGENFEAIRRHNRLADNSLAPGQRVVIPPPLLRPVFRAVLPSAHSLGYGEDRDGEVAVYRLQPGEALYSSVVVRFTGRVYAEDVNALAAEIAERSGIPDVTDIPVGFAVKIPFHLLQPEFLPAGHPRRREYEERLVATGHYRNPVHAERLQGITVVLDAGHGGADSGASLSGVWESLYVYDTMLRVKAELERRTAARVVPTTRDGASFAIIDRDVLPFSRDHRVLTTPHYPIVDSTVGVHLRWYLANSVLRRRLAEGADGESVVFVSLHADSLHPSLRGAMAYIPGAAWRGGSYSRSGPVYAARAEYRERPRVAFSASELARSEGLSRQLARSVMSALERRGLPIHPFKPVREKVVRQRQSWVPAVLRYNAVPAQVLLEVCNLANTEDRRRIQTRDFRQRVAEAVVDGIIDYYGDGGEGRQVAAGR